MKLNILISTINSGIEKISEILLEKRDDVEYIVSHQFTDPQFNYTPEILQRTDVKVFHINGKGLSKSRNYAIKNATGDIALIADDDVKYENEYFDKVLAAFADSDVDIALFKIKTINGNEAYKRYPETSNKISLKNIHSASSIEIAFKISSIANKISFDERFGLGSALIGGEENLFIRDAIINGLNVFYFPEYVVKHLKESTVKGYAKYDRQKNRVEGATDARMNGLLALPNSILKTIQQAMDMIKEKKNPFMYLTQRMGGVFYIISKKYNS